ncbi:hypothetical protein HNQ80_004823 [Anaerosolibacter carboniphilus]|uniref:DUF2313 domain-containing protein n=1 Tax=Anaerosolibacter carboniphilus TaxID=1417629 RepID=A0A841L8D6_9FIRM|nr:putative phage tail protein [Anaerosolibacter carboniphilus]MBB6218649.1 hypothetical protein [Anaerosolibacter carboniphilus]
MRQIETYWPPILQELREMKEISRAENPEIEAVWEDVENIMDDQFIQTATERGIARREKMLKINPFSDDTLETRRFRIQARWNEKLPYTYRVLQNRLNQLCGENGYEMTLNAGAYSLEIRIELTQKRMFDEVEKLSRQMVPANILLTVGLRYNQHSRLKQLTHLELQAYTHHNVRNEVIN